MTFRTEPSQRTQIRISHTNTQRERERETERERERERDKRKICAEIRLDAGLQRTKAARCLTKRERERERERERDRERKKAFKKAFDSIWHQGLFYKLIKSGIGGKTYDLIKSMYTECKCGVKINTKRTRYLSQERGVRQGCCLSPTLFNIYINELALSLE